MKLLAKSLATLIVVLVLSTNVHARKNTIKFDHISIDDGISQSTVTCILQDRRGFMWFGSWDGLNRYDGYTFKIYRHSPANPRSLSNNTIWTMYEDRSGTLWVGTAGGGLNKFDRQKEEFSCYTHDPDNPYSLGSNDVRSIYEDRSGTLWVGTGGGLNKFDRQKEEFSRYLHDPDDPYSLRSNDVRAIHEDDSGVLWIGTRGGGLSKFDPDKEQFIHYTHDPDDPASLSVDSILTLYVDRSGVLWIGTQGGGLNKLDREQGTFIHYKEDLNDPYSLSNDTVSDIFEDSAGSFWIATYGGGLNKFDREKEKFLHYKYDLYNPYTISSNRLYSLYQDKSGVLWIGADSAGLNKFSEGKEKFDHYKFEPYNPGSLSAKNVSSLYEDSSGIIWIGTIGGGLNQYDRKKERFVHYKSNPDDFYALSNDKVWSIHEDRSATLWVGTVGGGLNKFDREKKQFIHYKNEPDDPTSLGSDNIRVIHEDNFGSLWVSTWPVGLDKFDRENKRFIHYRSNPDDPHSLSSNLVFTIYEDRSGVLWIGTYGGGLNKFDRESEQFIRYMSDPDNPESLSNNLVPVIYEDRSGVLWIGTYGGGLNKFDREKEEFIRYQEGDGLPSNTIVGILEDDDGHLWISTLKGVAHFNPQTELFKNYDVTDGLQSNEFGVGAYCKSKSGEMFLGGINGFNRFHPDKTEVIDPYTPPVVITDFQLFNKSVPIGEELDGRSILKKSITEIEAIELLYDDNVFSFEFAALHYTFPEKNEYAYIMEGFDKDWHYVGTMRSATYTNLTPGKYIFRVKASNKDGVWNEKGTSLIVTIVPPFWATWWFRSCMVLSITMLIFTVYRIRTSTIRKQNERLEREIIERKRVEKQIKTAKDDLDNIIENSIDPIIITDTNGCISRVNKTFLNIFLYKEEDIIGKHTSEISPRETGDFESITGESICIDEEFITNSKTMLEKLYEEGSVSNWERYLLRNDGKLVPVESSVAILFDGEGNFTGGVGVARDISERKKFENVLKQSEEKYRSLIENANDAIISMNEDFTISEFNKKAEEMFGYSREEVLGRLILDLTPPAEREKGRQQIEAFKKNRELKILGTTVERKFRTKEGNTFPGECSTFAVDLYEEYMFTLFIRNITERKEMEQKILQSEKLKSLGELAGGVAHDFNNLLAAILGNAQLLKMSVESPQGIEERRKTVHELNHGLSIIEKAARDGAETVRRIQEFSRKRDEDSYFSTINLNEIIDNALDFTRIRWKDNAESQGIKIDIQKEFSPLPFVTGSASELREVFTNLINNAVDAMPQGGHLKIRTYEDDGFIAAQMEDTGAGIAEERKDKVFDPFFTTKGVKSSGLGLSVSYGIINRHQGTIQVDSADGKGTTFTIKIPAFEKATEEEKVTPSSGETKKVRILVIEDEEQVRTLLASILTKGGHEVEIASDGSRGLELFGKGEFDLVFTDLGMPGISGWQVAEKIKNINARVPVVLITGWEMQFEEKKLHDKCVDLVVQKPFEVAQVLNLVQEAMLLRDGLKELE